MQSTAHFTLASLIDIQKSGWRLSTQMLLHRKWKWIRENLHLIFRKQTWLIMRLTTILLLSACLQVSASGFSQDVTLSEKNVSLQKIFNQIHKQTGYQFFYEDEMLNKTGRINIKVKNMPLEKVLAICFKDLPMSYSIVNNVITLKRKTGDIVQAIEAPAFINIQGTVKDAQGQPLVGVSVIVKGTNKGTGTDANGHFSIDANAGNVLEFSIVGYSKKSVVVGSNNNLNVQLEVVAVTGSEIIVVGFGTQKKVDVIGAISQIDAKEINDRAVTQASQALTGQMPGVTVIQRSGQPGGASGGNIQVRGVGSFGANAGALVLIDGIPGQLDDIDPNDIASISVLKDAASAAIYGARAANGVILVTTKSGQSGPDGKIKISYNGYVGTQRATKYPDFLNSWDYAAMVNETAPGTYSDAQIQKFKDGSDPDNYPNVNYTDLVFKKGTLQTGNSVSISNRTKNTQYLLSFGGLYQNGIVPNNNYNRYNVRLNMVNNLTSKLKLSTRLSGIQEIDHEPAPPATLDFNDMLGAISQVIRFPAIYANQLSDGSYGRGQANKGTPYTYLHNESFFNSKWTNLLLNIRLDWEILKGLTASAIGGYTNNNNLARRFLANQTISPSLVVGPGNLSQSNELVEYKTLQQLLEYKKSVSNHNFDLLLGHTYEYNGDRTSSAFRNGYISNSLTELNAGDASTQSNSGTETEWALDSYFGRLQYNYNSKYLAEATVRRDGSSRFPPDLRYATFPGFAVGWRISQESFFKNNVQWIDELKLRASYGTLGNQNIGNYPWQNVLVSGSNYPFGGTISSGAVVQTLVDTSIHWESTRTKDIGIEGSALNRKLNFSIGYFDRYTYDILVSPSSSVSTVLGYSVGVSNSGKLSNRGWEFVLGYNDAVGKFSYGINANFSIINNKVLDLGVGNIKQPNGLVGNGSSLFIGYPMNVYYGYVTDGLFIDNNDIANYANQTAINKAPKPGDIRYKDISGPDGKPDGKVDATYDRKVLGSTIPKYTYGVNLSAGYMGFDINILLQGIAKVNGYMTGYAGWALYNSGNIQKWQMDGRWTASNPNRNAKYPRMEQITNAGTANTLTSTFWMLNGSYLRIKNIQLGYTFNKGMLRALKFESLRIYAAAENAFTFSNYPQGWDPEINTGGAYYPIMANYTFGLNVNF